MQACTDFACQVEAIHKKAVWAVSLNLATAQASSGELTSCKQVARQHCLLKVWFIFSKGPDLVKTLFFF